MIYFLLGFSSSLNIFMLISFIFIFKKPDFKSKIYEKIDEKKEILDPWSQI